jgi:hypothetical protein
MHNTKRVPRVSDLQPREYDGRNKMTRKKANKKLRQSFTKEIHHGLSRDVEEVYANGQSC